MNGRRWRNPVQRFDFAVDGVGDKARRLANFDAGQRKRAKTAKDAADPAAPSGAEIRRRLQRFAETLPSQELGSLANAGIIENGHPQARVSTGGRAPGDRTDHFSIAIGKVKSFLTASDLSVEAVLATPMPQYVSIGRMPGGTRTDFVWQKRWVPMRDIISDATRSALMQGCT